MNKRYLWTKENSGHLLKVLAYSVGSAIVAQLILFLQDIELPMQYMYLVPVVNAVLVAVKEFLNKER